MNGTAKRLLDVALAGMGLLVLSPVLVALAALVRLKLGRPVLFRQTRPGLDGVPFEMIKFRTMTDQRDDAGRLRPDEERLTSFGRFLRATSADELPELWNVLKGEMSLVGPRPPLPCEVEKYTAHEWKRLSVQPGITCFWQIGGRSNVPFAQWVELDLEYIRRQSLWLDLRILLLTIPAVLLGRGAR